jgi:transcriptional regulator with XRE-family HTH domain
MITGEQVKAARELLGWSQMTLALEASVDQSTVWKFETGKSQASGLSASTIERTLEAAGVEFTDGGVKLKAKARMLGSRPGI